ncbi:MAG TPA: UDP-N-acetylmuramoyl-L-alanine--D-glutamate ligase [Acidimicrobiales bacterium]|nr:UDP-N-acetylmuramoyl-L-alanine--D-glutamate ligase [Acidimicrobiales bacterium]
MGAGRVLVYGLGVSGAAVAATLAAEGVAVVAADDDAGPGPRARAAALGIEVVGAPSPAALAALVAGVDEIVVSPGVAPRHPVFAAAGDVPVVGEVELAWRRARCPVLAVTGSNGKTTVTTLVRDMLVASGRRAVAAGNIGAPLLEAVGGEAEVIVAEVSSFQLALTTTFHPPVAAWLNFSPDHLDWHASEAGYRAAKARLWARSGPGDVAVANAEDPVVLAEAAGPAARGATVVLFGLDSGDVRRRGTALVDAEGVAVAEVGELPRSMPHDLVDALCALATATAAGASREGCRRALLAFAGLPHRVELVGEANGVRYYDDSKATTPGAVLAALDGVRPAVLIAGGRNKGLDLGVLARGADRVRAVVAIGEAADEVAAAFDGRVPVRRAGTMADAVAAAGDLAQPGDAVLLSPACASFDWYASYGERGEDFARCVRALVRTLRAEPPAVGR